MIVKMVKMMKIFKNKVVCCLWMFSTVNLFQPAPLMAGVVDKASLNSSASLSADSSVWVLPAEQWEAGRSGNQILQMPVLKSLMQNWIQQYDANNLLPIELRYPGGEEGELWVQELADWLVSMGLPSKNIVMVPGSGTANKIKLTLVR